MRPSAPRHTGDEPVIDNCPVLVDIGCRVDDYCSDQTRTFWVGQQPTDAFRRTYDLVRQAQTLAIESMRPGQPLRDAYGHARAVLKQTVPPMPLPRAGLRRGSM